MESLPCDIVILPSEELAQQLITTSKSLADHSPLFTLDGINCYPHASIYMTQLKSSDLEKANELLGRIAAKTPVLSLTATRFDQEWGFLDAEYERTEQLVGLQQAVIEAINPIRDGMRENDKARMLKATGLTRDNLEKYGYRAVGDLFRPHATITRFADEGSTDIALLPDLARFNGQFTRLGLFEMGDNGTCVREIASYQFS